MKPIYTVGGTVVLALIVLAGWFITRANPQDITLDSLPVETVVSVDSETQTTPEAEGAGELLDEQLIATIEAGDATCFDAEGPCIAVSFDGTNCTVIGPTDNNAGVLTLIFSNRSEGQAKVEVGRLMDGKTIQDLVEDTKDRPTGYAPEWVTVMGFWDQKTIVPGETASFRRFIVEGDYGILCFKVPQYAIFGDGFTIIDKASNEEGIEKLGDQEPEIRALGKQLVAAIKDGDAAEIETLLSSGAKPNVVDSGGNVPLPLAARAGKLEIVQLLLEAGADVNSTMDGRHPDGDTVREATALLHAASRGYLDVVELLLANGADPNKVEIQEGDTPLHGAAFFDYADVIKILLENGADPDVQRISDGIAPLHWAARNGSSEAVEALVQGGANVNMKDLDRGLTPLLSILYFAPPNQQINLINLLLDHGANPDGQGNNGIIALHYAAGKGDVDIVETLLERGATIDFQNKDGQTALHRAAVRNRMEVVEVLIEHGASLDIEDLEGRKAFDVATGETIQEILREAGAGEGS